MKVVLTADSVRPQLTGIGQYTWQLASALAEFSPRLKIAFLQQNRIERQLPNITELTRGIARTGTHLARTPIKLNLPGIDYLVEQFTRERHKKVLRKERPDLFHGTNFTLVPSDAASVVTIHDLSVLQHPDYHPPTRVRRIRRKLRETVQHADIIITVSNCMCDELIRNVDLAPDRCHVTHLAAAEVFQPQTDQELRAKLAALDLDIRGYCLFCSTVEPRKNLTGLIQAYRKIPQSTRIRFPLIVVGGGGWRNQLEWTQLGDATREGWLRYLGFVDTDTQAALYAGCRLFVLPSHYEGFGLPLLEAMASGAPTICSTAEALVEVAGDAATTCPATDIGQLAELIRMGLENENWRRKSSRLGLRRAQDFSWQNCAKQTLNAYQHAMDINS